MLAGKADSFLCNVQMACNICYSTKSTVLFKHDLFGLRSRGAEKPGRLQSMGSQSRTRLCSSITPWFLYNIISSLYLKSPRAKYFYPSLIRALYVSKIYINPSLQFVDDPLLQFLFFFGHYMKTLWITVFFFLPLDSACLWVRVLCLYMLSFVTLQYDSTEREKCSFL